MVNIITRLFEKTNKEMSSSDYYIKTIKNIRNTLEAINKRCESNQIEKPFEYNFDYWYRSSLETFSFQTDKNKYRIWHSRYLGSISINPIQEKDERIEIEIDRDKGKIKIELETNGTIMNLGMSWNKIVPIDKFSAWVLQNDPNIANQIKEKVGEKLWQLQEYLTTLKQTTNFVNPNIEETKAKIVELLKKV